MNLCFLCCLRSEYKTVFYIENRKQKNPMFLLNYYRYFKHLFAPPLKMFVYLFFLFCFVFCFLVCFFFVLFCCFFWVGVRGHLFFFFFVLLIEKYVSSNFLRPLLCKSLFSVVSFLTSLF